MSRLGIFIADGCEEVEALTVVDIVRRAKLEIDMITINGQKMCSIQYYLRFWLGICRTSLAVSALRIMRYCLYLKNQGLPLRR